MEFAHYSVMRAECVDALQIRPDGVYIDMTVGGGGHALAIAERLSTGRLIGIDRDADALAAASKRLAPFMDRVTLIRDNYKNVKAIAAALQIEHVDGILCDMGVSSYQLDAPERGFSYRFDAPLDMRMDQSAPLTAADVVNTYSEQALADIIFRYGEERYARRIAAKIAAARPLQTTGQLAELVKSAFPPAERFGDKHPAKRTFQAIRIEVNEELKSLDQTFEDAVELLVSGGRIAVMTFHSLEDRIVKNTFKRLSQGCICDKSIPVCVCGNKEVIRLVSRKPITAGQRELAENHRSRPAKLRIGEKL